MSILCVRCGQEKEPPPPHRVPFPPTTKETILTRICSGCWNEWEGTEIKVINEYRLNLLEPEHRAMLQKACLSFLRIDDPPVS